MSVIGKVF